MDLAARRVELLRWPRSSRGEWLTACRIHRRGRMQEGVPKRVWLPSGRGEIRVPPRAACLVEPRDMLPARRRSTQGLPYWEHRLRAVHFGNRPDSIATVIATVITIATVIAHDGSRAARLPCARDMRHHSSQLDLPTVVPGLYARLGCGEGRRASCRDRQYSTSDRPPGPCSRRAAACAGAACRRERHVGVLQRSPG